MKAKGIIEMKLNLKSLLVASLVGVTLIPSAQAHRMWILPSTFTLSGDEQWITVDGAISNDLFFPNHVAMDLDDIIITLPDGKTSSPENGWKGKIRTTFDLKLDQQGTYKVTENGSLYFASWKEDGEEKRRRGSLSAFKEDGLFEKDGLKLMHSSRRVETYVTLGAPSNEVFKLSSKGVEMQPITHPNDVYTGEEVSFKFYVDGEIAKDLDVLVIKGNDRYRDNVEQLELKTDSEGVVRFTPEIAGRYWMSINVRKPGKKDGRDMMFLNAYSATFEALVL